MPDIDASEAIERLGITRPVEFIHTDRHRRNPIAWAFVDPELGTNTVVINHAVIREEQGMGIWPERDLAWVIAHELTHVRQLQDFEDPQDMVLAYQFEWAARGYHNISFEIEANERAVELAPLIKVTP